MNQDLHTASDPPILPDWTPRQVVYATLLISAIGAAFFLLFRYNQIVFTLFIAIVVSTAIRPLVNRLNSYGVSRAAGVLLVYVTIVVLVAGIAAGVAPLIGEQLGSIGAAAPQYYASLRSGLFLSENLVLQRIALGLPEQIGLPGTAPAGEAVPPAAEAPPAETPAPAVPVETGGERRVSLLGLIGRGVLGLVSVFVLGFYWTLERDRSVRGALLWAPSTRRESLRELIHEMENKVGQFVVGQGILCLAVGGMALASYLLIGVPYALVLALVAGVTEAIPVIGPVLGALPALIVALATDPGMAVWVLVSAAVIQTAENYILVPRVMNRSVGVNTLVLLLSFVSFSLLFGLGGAIVSVPLAAVLQMLFDRYLLKPSVTSTQPKELGRDQVSLYRMETQSLAADIRKQLVSDQEQDPEAEASIDALETIAAELEAILARSVRTEEAA